MSNDLIPQGNILLYSGEDGKEYVNVYYHDETFWLTQAALADLFDCAKSNISMHLTNIFDEGELLEDHVLRKFRISELSTKPTNFYKTFECVERYHADNNFSTRNKAVE